MSFVYRYIDTQKLEVVYIGKVNGFAENDGSNSTEEMECLKRRHEQHKREQWYKNIGNENILFQFMHLQTQADADIYETMLISYYYGTGQLANKAKTNWGKCTLPIICKEDWHNYCGNYISSGNEINGIFNGIILRLFEDGVKQLSESDTQHLTERINDILAERYKALNYNSIYFKNELFLRKMPKEDKQ